MKRNATEKTELEKRLEEEAVAESAQPAEADAAEPQTAQNTPAEPPATEPPAAPEVDVNALLTERDALKDQILRARADFDNYRKRTARENERIRKTAAESVIRDLLPVIDNLERALEHVEDVSSGLGQGVDMVCKQIADVFGKHGVAPIPATGEKFDPQVHEAVAHVPSADHPADTVMQELLRGYRLGDQVLRASRVIVSAGAPQTEPEPETKTE